MMVFPSSAVYSVTTTISRATYLSISELVSGTGAMLLLFYGWAVSSQVFALQYGKRPAYLFFIFRSVIIIGMDLGYINFRIVFNFHI
jgi:hypothetical protein